MKKILFFLVAVFPAVLCAQNKLLDSLQTRLKTSGQDTARVNLLNKLSDKYTDVREYDKAFTYAKEARTLATKLNYYSGIAWSDFMTGRATWKKGDAKAAVPYYRKAEKLHLALADTPAIARTQAMLGLVCAYAEHYPQSLEYLYKALRLYEMRGDSESMAKVQLNLGFSYIGQFNGPKAGPNYRAAYKYFKRKKLIPGQMQALMNLGSLYSQQPPYDSSKHCYEMALDLATQLGDKKSISSLLVNLGNISKYKKDTLTALVYYTKGLKIAEEISDWEGRMAAVMNIAAIYEFQNRTDTAIEYFRQTYAIASKMRNLEYAMFAAHHLANLYAAKGDYKKAYEYRTEKANLSDSLVNDKNLRKSMQVEMNFEYERKELALKSEAEKRELLLNEENKRQQTRMVSIIAILILLLFIAILLIRQIRHRNEQREIQLEHKLLRTQMNPHFIFNCLHAIQNFVLNNNSREAAKYLSAIAKITRSVLENSRTEVIPLQNEIALLENYMQLQKLRFGNRFDYQVFLDPDIDKEHIVIPPMLAQPFIENALEHGMKDVEKGGRIDVSLIKKDRYLELEVKDNGKGISQKSSRDQENQSLATAITKERIGLLNRKNKVKILFSISEAYPDGPNKGVKVRFSIPIQHGSA
jgi:tetratricopeptide (TPR) repeat protein